MQTSNYDPEIWVINVTLCLARTGRFTNIQISAAGIKNYKIPKNVGKKICFLYSLSFNAFEEYLKIAQLC